MAAKKKAAKKGAKKAAKKSGEEGREEEGSAQAECGVHEGREAERGTRRRRGHGPLPRTEVTKKLWAYIKRKGLQDSKNRRNINADAALKPIFKKDQVNMFEMTKLVSKHLS